MVATAATAPHLIMTYCALLALAVLRDDYALLDRAALKRMVGACQDADGGCVLFAYYLLSSTWIELCYGPGLASRFATMPGVDDADLRMTYCAFVVCALLGDWSCIDLPRALSYIHRCRVRVSHSPPSPTLSFPLRMKSRRRTKVDTDKRHRVNRSADRRIALSRHYTSSRPTTYVRLRRVYSTPSGTRQYAGYCRCKWKRWHL